LKKRHLKLMVSYLRKSSHQFKLIGTTAINMLRLSFDEHIFYCIFSLSLRNEKSKIRCANYLRQYVAITGLNLEVFNTTLEGLGRVYRYFEDMLPKYEVEPLEPVTIHEHIAMACYTRYFLPYRSCKTAVRYPFGPEVDPDGVLERLGGNSFLHTEDNVVQYLGKRVDEEKYVKYWIIRKTTYSFL